MTSPVLMDYHADGSSPSKHARHIVLVPPNIDDKKALLQVLSSALRFPAYFGFNWDALDECMGDLSWLEPGEIVIWHEDIPLSSHPNDARTYLEIMGGAARESEASITISFPESAKTRVMQLTS